MIYLKNPAFIMHFTIESYLKVWWTFVLQDRCHFLNLN